MAIKKAIKRNYKLDPAEKQFHKDTIKLKKCFRKYLTKYYGKRCKSKCPGCVVCRRWALNDLIDITIVY